MRNFVIFISALALCSGVRAGDESVPLSGGLDVDVGAEMPMFMTPARLSQPQSQVPASVTVIDRELIEASGAREIYQLMQLVPGMAAVKVDGNIPTVSYHATQARDVRRMLVLIDGRSQYQPGLARVLWNDLPIEIEDIERIEVTRGPASAAYGANAFQGVINIITRHPRDVQGVTAATRGGNNGVRDWRVTGAGGADESAFRVTAASKRDDGYDGDYVDSSLGDLLVEDKRETRQSDTLNLRSVFELDGGSSVEVLAGGARTELRLLKEETDVYQIFDMDHNPKDVSEQAFVQLVWDHAISPRQQLRVQTYAQYTQAEQRYSGCVRTPEEGIYFTQELRDFWNAIGRDYPTLQAAFANPATLPPDVLNRIGILSAETPLCGDINLDIEEQRYDLEIQDTILIDDYTRLVIGANLRQDVGYSDSYTNGRVDNFSRRIFGNLEIHLADPLFLNFGGYWEKDDLNGTNFSPRSALIYEFLPANSLRLVVAESVRTMDLFEKRADIRFRIENMNEPYASDPIGLLGTDSGELALTHESTGALVPEKIRSREVGYFGKYRMFEWDIRYYEERLRDLVSGSLSIDTFEEENNGKVDINGREAQLTWRVTPRHLLRLTGDHRHSRSNERPETRLYAADSASALWRWDVTRQWMFSAAGYLAHDYNQTRYERADVQLLWDGRIAGSNVKLGAVVQQDLTNDPVVFEENVYRKDRRFWLSGSITF